MIESASHLSNIEQPEIFNRALLAFLVRLGAAVTHPLWIVDAFTAEPFAGNPAAVCLLDGPADAPWMQAVAREMGFSETAFLHAEGDAYRLRWFTPAIEVELCGHATLASAHVLWTEGILPAGAPATFETLSGRLRAERSPARG